MGPFTIESRRRGYRYAAIVHLSALYCTASMGESRAGDQEKRRSPWTNLMCGAGSRPGRIAVWRC